MHFETRVRDWYGIVPLRGLRSLVQMSVSELWAFSLAQHLRQD